MNIYCVIKKVPKKERESHIKSLLIDVGLYEKVNSQTKTLSGGQVRILLKKEKKIVSVYSTVR